MAEPTTSNYPGALDTSTTLAGDQVNIKSFTLGSNVNDVVTSIPASATITGVTAPFYLLAESELMYVEGISGSNFTPVVRGAGGTTAASHSSGITLYVVYAANLFNQLKRAIIAIETELGISPSGVFTTAVARLDAMLNMPDGTMINGKINVTVASNNLTVAIKTYAGTDPSATDPVYVKINGTVRTITAATSITLASATGWFGAGGSEFATKEIDYFAYAVWDSNSSIVAVSAARIPFGRLVSDFSATTTNEKHLGNYANFTATDDVVVIGRFAATLSAGLTWTVPTFTNANLIQHPIFETRTLSWVPGWTNLTVGNATVTATYRIVMRRILVSVALVFGSTTSISGAVDLSYPFTRTETNLVMLGLAHLQDTGTLNYGGVVRYISSTVLRLFANNVSATYESWSTISSTIPHTWATTDEINLEYEYNIG